MCHVDPQIALGNSSTGSTSEIRSDPGHLLGTAGRCGYVYRRSRLWLDRGGTACSSFSSTAAGTLRSGRGVFRHLRGAARVWGLVAARRSSAFLFPLPHGTAKAQWHALHVWRAARTTPKLEMDSRRGHYELKTTSNQSLQPTALWRCVSMSILISVFSVGVRPRSQSGG